MRPTNSLAIVVADTVTVTADTIKAVGITDRPVVDITVITAITGIVVINVDITAAHTTAATAHGALEFTSDSSQLLNVNRGTPRTSVRSPGAGRADSS